MGELKLALHERTRYGKLGELKLALHDERLNAL
jgi:hypothetical protein